MARSLPPIGSMAVLALLLIYVYGMVGWLLFGDELPSQWGDIGAAMLTLFTVLTLEGWNEVLYDAQEVHPQAWIFLVSFVLMASFLVINIVIAIIINSVEEAREADRALRVEREHAEAAAAGRAVDEDLEVEARLLAVKRAVEELETELAVRGHSVKDPDKKPKLRARSRRGRA
jgi:voltage-gated sodium channel